MHSDDTGNPGLRARKKLATRQALSCAAARLALEHGLDNVRVEDIAAAAGVSPRTYNNYFSCREEAICAIQAERAQQVGAALRARPPDEPLAAAIAGALAELYAGHEPDRAMITLITSTPVLRGEFLKTIATIERSLAEAIAERTGADHDDLFAGVLAATVAGAIRVSIECWLRRGPDTAFVTVLRDALSRIAPVASTCDWKAGRKTGWKTGWQAP